jgi:hypothetical protein
VWWWFPHYSAPTAPLVLAAVALLLRSVAGSAPFWRARRFAPAALVVLAALNAATDLAIPASAKPSRPTRIDVLAYLEKQPGSHLVFVTYDDEVSLHEEWVWNRAELESSPVIFAHYLGDTKNAELVAAYPGRSLWLVIVSSSDAGLRPYLPRRHEPLRQTARAASRSGRGPSCRGERDCLASAAFSHLTGCCPAHGTTSRRDRPRGTSARQGVTV